jgi:hypothetical protein
VVWYKILCGIPEEKDWLSFFELQIMWPYSAPDIRQLWVCFHGININLQKYYSYLTLTFTLVAWWKENLMKWQLRFNLNLILKMEPF